MLVVAIGALELGNLPMHQRLELGGASERARDGVVHGADLPAHGLAERGDLLLGHPVRLGETDRHLRHGRAHVLEFLGADREIGEEPEQRDRHRNDREGCHRSRGQQRGKPTACIRHVLGEHRNTQDRTDGTPGDRANRGNPVGLARGLLLERVDEAADRGAVIIGGDTLAGRSERHGGGRPGAQGPARAGPAAAPGSGPQNHRSQVARPRRRRPVGRVPSPIPSIDRLTQPAEMP